MIKHLLSKLAILAIANQLASAVDLPIASPEKEVIDKIVAIEGIEIIEAAKPGFSARAAADGLASLGIAKERLESVTIQASDNERRAISITHDRQGHVLAITGNGPWLRNESLQLLTGLPELRMIRLDHNTPVPKSDVDPVLYSGAGFSALVESKLAIVKIGHAFNDEGMKALAQIPSLRQVHIGHSKVTDDGVAALANHPNLEDVSFAPMGRPNVTNRTLAVLATLPKIRRIGMNETFVTYAGGFEHLKPLSGQLESVALKWSLVQPADLEKLKADHPGLEVTTSTMAEVAEKRFRRNQLLKWASPEAAAFLKANESP